MSDAPNLPSLPEQMESGDVFIFRMKGAKFTQMSPERVGAYLKAIGGALGPKMFFLSIAPTRITVQYRP